MDSLIPVLVALLAVTATVVVLDDRKKKKEREEVLRIQTAHLIAAAKKTKRQSK